MESIASNADATIKTSTEASITRENFEFIEWNTQADGKGTAYKPQETIRLTEDITLYAQWEEIIEPI